jgi:hypothetical protein
MKQRPPRSFRPQLEKLEDRLTPAGNVTSSFTGGSLTLTGDALANAITISENGSGQIVVTPDAGTNTTLDGNTAAESFTLTGSLTVALGAGNDSVFFDLTNPITIPGSLSITYGSATGDKHTEANNAGDNAFTVGQNLAISYGAGAVTTEFFCNLVVGSNSVPKSGNVTITHGPGDSTTAIASTAAAGTFGSILGNLSVTNTSGVAVNVLADTNVGGNVTYNNGKAGAGNVAGSTEIFNDQNSTTQATIGGNVAISNQSGNTTGNLDGLGDFIGDVHIHGNVTMKLGTGKFTAVVSGDIVPQAPRIDGNLSITGTGSDSVELGGPPLIAEGLNVNGSLSVLLGGAGSDSLDLTSVVVGKNTTLTTGSGNASVTLNDAFAPGNSEYHGSFSLTTGVGNDSVAINSSGGTGGVIFDGPVTANLGAGNDTMSLATTGGVTFNAAPDTFDGQGGTNHAFVTLGNITGTFPTVRNFLNG